MGYGKLRIKHPESTKGMLRVSEIITQSVHYRKQKQYSGKPIHTFAGRLYSVHAVVSYRQILVDSFDRHAGHVLMNRHITIIAGQNALAFPVLSF